MSANTRRFRKGSVGRRGIVFVSLAGLAALAGTFLFSVRETPAELQTPQNNDRYVTRIVTDLLNKEHLSKRALDNEVSRRAMDVFLRQLDPMKIYFQQSDIDEFMTSRELLDDYVKRGDTSFAYKVFRRYLERLDQRVADIEELLKIDHDFTIDEELIVEPGISSQRTVA